MHLGFALAVQNTVSYRHCNSTNWTIFQALATTTVFGGRSKYTWRALWAFVTKVHRFAMERSLQLLMTRFRQFRIGSFFWEIITPFVMHFDLFIPFTFTNSYITHYLKANTRKSIMGDFNHSSIYSLCFIMSLWISQVTLVKMRSHISSCTKVQEQMANCPKFMPVVPTSQPIPR